VALDELNGIAQVQEPPADAARACPKPPTNFAAGDIKAIQFAVRSAAILTVSFDGYVMVLNGTTDPDNYGKLVPLDDSDRQHRMRMGVFVRQCSPGEGLLILEIQERVLSFLVACCQSILRPSRPTTSRLTSSPSSRHPIPRLRLTRMALTR
jgi:hypothetical protein